MGAKNLIRTTCSINGTPIPGEFRTFSGGELSMTERKNRNGAGERARAKRGLLTTGNVTITREDDGTLDLDWAERQRGKAMVVVRQPLDDDRNPRGKARVYTGLLMRVGIGETDVNDESDDDVFELEMLTDDV